MRFFLLDRRLAAIDIGDEREIPCARETIRHAADLFVQSPPLLDDNDGGSARSILGFRKVAVDFLAVRAPKGNRFSKTLLHTYLQDRKRGFRKSSRFVASTMPAIPKTHTSGLTGGQRTETDDRQIA